RKLAKEILTSPYQLIDLTQITDEQLREDLWYGTMALALKHAHDIDIVPFVRGIIERLKKLQRFPVNE
ncbi:MAG TPA: Rpn family recombination-promoting nuclease/putative transposase, partial [Thermodesulfovibrionia bacterium]|nr:Rpn family recombination-promoting nuclease/putative transposase [Thermodesulfovibrionia bacterium]